MGDGATPSGLPARNADGSISWADDAPEGIDVITPEGESDRIAASDYKMAVDAGYRIPVTGPKGESADVLASEYEKARATGYKAAPEVEHAHGQMLYGDRPVAAFLAGAGRSASLGLTDLIGTATGAVKPETFKGLEEYNRLSSGIGEGAGVVLPMLVPGLGEASAIGLAGKAGHAAIRGAEALGVAGAETLAKRIAGKVIGGGVEGMVFSLGNVVSEHSLGDPDLNAQRIAAELGLGALIGGGISGLVGAAEEGVKAAGPKVGEFLAKSQENMQKVSNDYTLKSSGATASELGKVAAADRPALAKAFVERGHTTGGIRGINESLSKDLEQQAMKVGDQLGLDVVRSGELSALTPKGQAAKDIAESVIAPARQAEGKTLQAALEKADAATDGPAFDILKVTNRAREEVLAKIEGDPALVPDAAKLSKYLDGYEKLAQKSGGMTFQEAHELESNLRQSLSGMSTRAERSAVGKLRGIFRDELGGQIGEKVGADISKEFEGSMERYGLLAEAEKLAAKGRSGKDILAHLVDKAGIEGGDAETFRLLSKGHDLSTRGMARLENNRGSSITDYMAGIGLSHLASGPLGILTGAAGMVGNKIIRERGSVLIGKILQQIADSPTLARVAQHFAYAVEKTPPALLGEFGPQLANAAARGGPRELLAEHLAMSETNAAYRKAATVAGFIQHGTEEATHALGKVHALSGVQRIIEEHGERLGHAVAKAMEGGGEHQAASEVLTKQEFGTKRMRRDAASAHRKHAEDVVSMAANPSVLADRVAQNLGGLGAHAPAIAAASAATASRAVSFLASKLPQHNQGPLAREWEPSATEISSFNAYYKAVQDPHSVLKQAAAGTLTPEAVDAVKTVYPKLFQQMQSEVLDQLTDRPEVPYRQRVMLSILMGIDPDGSLAPDAILRNQQALSGPSKKNPEDQLAPQSQVRPTAKGASNVTLSRRSMTPLEATSNRED